MVKNKKAGSFFKEPAAVINNKVYPFLFLFMTFSVRSIISGTSNRYIFQQVLGVPLSPNVSFVPTYSIGIGKYLPLPGQLRPPILQLHYALPRLRHILFFARN